MAGWSKITDLRLVPEFEKAHIPPDGRCVLAVDVYFKAIDENNDQMDRLPDKEMFDAVDLIEGRDGREKLKYVDHVSEVPPDADYWFYTLHTDGAVRASASGSNAGAGQDDVYDIDGIDWGKHGGTTGKKPPEGDGEHEKPVPQHSGKDYQHIRYYVGCGYKAERALTLGASIKPPQSKEPYLSWTGGSGEHHFGITLDLMAAGQALDQRLKPGVYYVVPKATPGTCIHPVAGRDLGNNQPVITYPEFAEHARWRFIADPKNSDRFLIQNTHNGEFYFYIYRHYSRDDFTGPQVLTGNLPAEAKDYGRFSFKITWASHDQNYGNVYKISAPDCPTDAPDNPTSEAWLAPFGRGKTAVLAPNGSDEFHGMIADYKVYDNEAARSRPADFLHAGILRRDGHEILDGTKFSDFDCNWYIIDKAP